MPLGLWFDPVPLDQPVEGGLQPRCIVVRILGEVVFEFSWSYPFPIVDFLWIGLWNAVVFPDEYVIEFVLC